MLVVPFSLTLTLTLQLHTLILHSLTLSHPRTLNHSPTRSFLSFPSSPFPLGSFRFFPFLHSTICSPLNCILPSSTFRWSIIHIISIHPDTMQQQWSPQLQPSTRRQGNDGATLRTEDADSSYLQPTPGLERTPLGLKPVESRKHPTHQHW